MNWVSDNVLNIVLRRDVSVENRRLRHLEKLAGRRRSA